MIKFILSILLFIFLIPSADAQTMGGKNHTSLRPQQTVVKYDFIRDMNACVDAHAAAETAADVKRARYISRVSVR